MLANSVSDGLTLSSAPMTSVAHERVGARRFGHSHRDRRSVAGDERAGARAAD